MAKQITLSQHKLSDEIVQLGLQGITLCLEGVGKQGYITGGMAVQNYVPASFGRGTIDVDFNSLWNSTSVEEFRAFSAPLIEMFAKLGYQTAVKKKGFTFDCTVSKNDEALLIQHKRFSNCNFARNKSHVERELKNARLLPFKYGAANFMAPEDVVAHKASRLSNFSHLYELSIAVDSYLEVLKTKADEFRAKTLSGITDESPENVARNVAQLRMLYDAYDIQCLDRFASLDKAYLKEAFRDIKGLTYVSGSLEDILSQLGVSL